MQPSLLTSFIFHLHISCIFHLWALSLELPLFLSTLSLELIPHWVFPPEDRAATSSSSGECMVGVPDTSLGGSCSGAGTAEAFAFSFLVLFWFGVCLPYICLLLAEGLPRVDNWMHCTAARILIQDLEFSLLHFRPLFGPSSRLLPTGSLADYQSYWGPVPTPSGPRKPFLAPDWTSTQLPSPQPIQLSSQHKFVTLGAGKQKKWERENVMDEGIHHTQQLLLHNFAVLLL